MNNIERTVDKYGFKEINVMTTEGAHITIVSFLTNENLKGDIGLLSSSNGRGLGGGYYIRNDNDKVYKENIESHLKDIDRIVWLNEEEKEALRSFLREMREEYDKLKGA